MYNVTLRRVRVTTFRRGRAMSITYSECVCVSLVVQHTLQLSYVAWLALPYFSILSLIEHPRIIQQNFINVEAFPESKDTSRVGR